MNSKERVNAVLRGEIPDRVPIADFSIDFDTIEKVIGHETYVRAKAKSRIAFWEGRRQEVAQSFIEDQIELYRQVDFDIISVAPEATWHIPDPTDDPPPRRVDDVTWEDKYGRVYKYSETTADITCVHDPVAQQAVFRVEDFSGPPEETRMNDLSRRVADTVISAFKDDRFIIGPALPETGITFLGNMERGLMEIATNPDVVKAAAEHEFQSAMLSDKNFIRPHQEAVLWGQDWGYNTGPFVNPRTIRDLFLPLIKRRVAHMRDDLGIWVVKHCCGNMWALLDMFVEIGYDAYQSIQPTASMDIAEVKKRYGDKLTLWGGVPVEQMVAGTPEDIQRSVRRAMRVGKPGGRFILGTSHSIAVGSKYDNFMAMRDEHRKLAAY